MLFMVQKKTISRLQEYKSEQAGHLVTLPKVVPQLES